MKLGYLQNSIKDCDYANNNNNLNNVISKCESNPVNIKGV